MEGLNEGLYEGITLVMTVGKGVGGLAVSKECILNDSDFTFEIFGTCICCAVTFNVFTKFPEVIEFDSDVDNLL